MEQIEQWLNSNLIKIGLSEHLVDYVSFSIGFIIMMALAFIAYKVSRQLILKLIAIVIKKTKTEYDDIFLEASVFDRLSRIAPAIVIQTLTPFVFHSVENLIPFIVIITDIYIVLVLTAVASSFIGALQKIFVGISSLRDKPINSFLQVFKVLLYCISGVVIFAYLLGQNPLGLLGAMGAFTAVILLIFKDTILGFVAGIQLAVNDMVRVGDWVSVPKFGADGNVLEINLTTVKVENWDNTITTVPTYAFVSDGITNWRNMTESGGRRIKRSIQIKIDSIKFCKNSDIKRYSKIELVKEYLINKQKEVDDYNTTHSYDKSVLINGRNLTNIGVFREYALQYLKTNENIHQDMTVMVRQLEAVRSGVPIELYCFTNDTAWVNYENIQADIFDHLMVAASVFDLEIFQNPTGKFSK